MVQSPGRRPSRCPSPAPVTVRDGLRHGSGFPRGSETTVRSSRRAGSEAQQAVNQNPPKSPAQAVFIEADRVQEIESVLLHLGTVEQEPRIEDMLRKAQSDLLVVFDRSAQLRVLSMLEVAAQVLVEPLAATITRETYSGPEFAVQLLRVWTAACMSQREPYVQIRVGFEPLLKNPHVMQHVLDLWALYAFHPLVDNECRGRGKGVISAVGQADVRNAVRQVLLAIAERSIPFFDEANVATHFSGSKRIAALRAFTAMPPEKRELEAMIDLLLVMDHHCGDGDPSRMSQEEAQAILQACLQSPLLSTAVGEVVQSSLRGRPPATIRTLPSRQDFSRAAAQASEILLPMMASSLERQGFARPEPQAQELLKGYLPAAGGTTEHTQFVAMVVSGACEKVFTAVAAGLDKYVQVFVDACNRGLEPADAAASDNLPDASATQRGLVRPPGGDRVEHPLPGAVGSLEQREAVRGKAGRAVDVLQSEVLAVIAQEVTVVVEESLGQNGLQGQFLLLPPQETRSCQCSGSLASLTEGCFQQ
mmetsp:Transcript_56630/g.124178  ORF Transcript_56630/g.124178 Transcript_56630/m.124178 type:complete len:534 (+) Transcript_56630:1-1602(+)